MKLTKVEEPDNKEPLSFYCGSCDLYFNPDECDFDTEPDEFKGTDRKYPICPKCKGSLEY